MILHLTSIRIEKGSTDGEVTVVMKPKYTEARQYAMPAECLDQMMTDLVSLGVGSRAKPADKPNQIEIRTPKKWMVGSGLPKYKWALLIFDPQSEAQCGFALGIDAASEIAAALTKNVEALKKQLPESPGSEKNLS